MPSKIVAGQERNKARSGDVREVRLHEPGGEMERHEVEALLVLAEELHFGRTAQRLHVSTTRVSQTIKQLERRVGVPLFERTSRHVALTAIGEQLVGDVRPGYEQIQAGLTRAIDAARGVDGELGVGFVGAATGQLLVQAEKRFTRQYPGTTVRLREMQVGEATNRLLDGDIDLMLGCFPITEPGLVTGPVALSEPWLLAVPTRHPLARRAEASIDDTRGEPFLRAPCGLAPEGVEPGPAADTFQEVLTLVGAGKGVFAVGAHVARFHARPDVAFVKLNDVPNLEWGPVWRANGATARVRAFVAAVTGG
jgi:DNA-binding transcriptional LysR family regulator